MQTYLKFKVLGKKQKKNIYIIFVILLRKNKSCNVYLRVESVWNLFLYIFKREAFFVFKLKIYLFENNFISYTYLKLHFFKTRISFFKILKNQKMNTKLLLAFILGCLVHVAYPQCSNQNDSLCTIFGTQYCDGTSYLNGMLYSMYCAKLCNNCNCKFGGCHILKFCFSWKLILKFVLMF